MQRSRAFNLKVQHDGCLKTRHLQHLINDSLLIPIIKYLYNILRCLRLGHVVASLFIDGHVNERIIHDRRVQLEPVVLLESSLYYHH